MVRKFEFTGVYDLGGNPKQLASGNELKLVVFWSLDSPISVSLIQQIEGIKEDFRSRRVKVIAVCEVEGEEMREQWKSVAAENRSIEFLCIKRDDRASQLFAERFPVRKFPYLLMLSVDNKVAGVNVDPVFFDPIGR